MTLYGKGVRGESWVLPSVTTGWILATETPIMATPAIEIFNNCAQKYSWRDEVLGWSDTQ
jgi:hypothetical protein